MGEARSKWNANRDSDYLVLCHGKVRTYSVKQIAGRDLKIILERGGNMIKDGRASAKKEKKIRKWGI